MPEPNGPDATTFEPRLHESEPDGHTERRSQLTKIGGIAGDDHVVSGRSPNHYCSIDNVGGTCAATSSPGCLGPTLLQFFDAATLQKPGELCLRGVSPGLREHTGRHRRHDLPFERPSVQSPDPSITPVGCDERSGIVRQTARHPVSGTEQCR